MIQAIGGFKELDGYNEPASIAEQIYAPDELENAAIRGEIDIDELSPGKGENRRYRSWRVDRAEKIRCAQRRVTTREGEHLLYHFSVAVGPEAASLFSPADIVRLHPGKIIERVLRAGVGLSGPVSDPVVMLRLLQELATKPAPRIWIEVGGELRMTNQGDDDVEAYSPVANPSEIRVGRKFTLEIEIKDANKYEFVVFEYSNSTLVHSSSGTTKIAAPMQNMFVSVNAVLVTASDLSPLVAGPALGSFGFAVVAIKNSDAIDLHTEPGRDRSARMWDPADVNEMALKLRRLMVFDHHNVLFTMRDYQKVLA